TGSRAIRPMPMSEAPIRQPGWGSRQIGAFSRLRGRLLDGGIEMRNPFKGDSLGVHFAVNIFVATTFLWLVLWHGAGLDPIWAVSSMVAASDPEPQQAAKFFYGRLVNALIGCATGLAVLAVGGTSEWKVPVALSLSVLISTYLVRVRVMYRQAPITAAIVVAGGLMQHSKT